MVLLLVGELCLGPIYYSAAIGTNEEEFHNGLSVLLLSSSIAKDNESIHMGVVCLCRSIVCIQAAFAQMLLFVLSIVFSMKLNKLYDLE